MTGAPGLRGIAQVAFTVPDLPAAVAFYRETLGLPVLFQTPAMAMLACGPARVMLATPDQNPTTQPTFVYFQVDDIHAAIAAVRAKGGKVEQEPHAVGRFAGREVWLAGIADPAGTLLQLIAEVPGKEG